MTRTILTNDGLEDYDFGGKLPAKYIHSFIRDKATLKAHMRQIPWTQVEYPMYGKTRITPRLTWCYGRLQDSVVRYRGKSFQTEIFPEWLAELRDQVARETGFTSNAAILNFYPNGTDHINWHADDEKFLAEKTVASISICAERVFSMRDTDHRYDITLRDGSLLMMYDGTEHCLDAQKGVRGRFNITLRKLASEKGVGNYYYYNRGLENAL
jgi:alkylated DNA repair dioxygenase AlkB